MAARPLVLFLHGLFGKPDNFRLSRERLGRDWPVADPTLPLFDLPIDRTNVDGLVAHVEDLIQERGASTVVAVGNSLGGHIALRLALHWPERVAGLVLSGSSGLFERGLEGAPPRRPDRVWVRRKVEEVFHDRSHATEPMIDEVLATIGDRRRVLRLVRLAASAKRESLRARLGEIRCPTLLVWGRQDRITPPEVAEQFQAYLGNAELRLIDACGHAPPIERPSAFAGYLGDFLVRHFGVESMYHARAGLKL